MTKTRKISLFAGIFAVLAIVLFGFILTGCGDVTQETDETKVHSANITSWYEYDGAQYLDTSVNINFDNLNIADIDKITFELYQDDQLLGDAVSEGDNLVTLLKDCAQYWEQTEDTYLEVKGDRTISCAFTTRTETNDNGFWVRSECSATPENVPNKLVVKVLVGDVEYVAEYQA